MVPHEVPDDPRREYRMGYERSLGLYYDFVHTVYATGYIVCHHVEGDKTSVFCLFPRSAHSLEKVFGSDAFSARKVSSCDLRIDFNSRVHRNKVF